MTSNPNSVRYWSFVMEKGRWFRGRCDSQSLLRGLSFTPKIRGCYYNSQLLALFRAGLAYFEGWACDDMLPLPLEHAWCVSVRSGKVIDATWDIGDKGKGRDSAVYFGIEIPVQMIRKCILKSKMSGPLLTRLIFSEGE